VKVIVEDEFKKSGKGLLFKENRRHPLENFLINKNIIYYQWPDG